MNRVILIAIVVVISAIWIAAMANACTPRAAGSAFGPSWAPIFIGGGGWDRGGWDRGTVSNPSPSRSSSSSSSSSRSSGGSIRSGGIKGGSGGK